VSIPAAADRTTKYRFLRVLLQGGNGLLRWELHRRMAPKAFALLETTGRRTGLPRHTPVGNGLAGDTFWLIAAHGRQADFVRNIVAEPRVRVLVNRGWRSGVAVLMPGDDTQARSRELPSQADAAIGRLLATTPMTIRIDLDPVPPSVGQPSPGGR
jgi:deazaflavin-dependent oxidoreductase (nitroreductase family)